MSENKIMPFLFENIRIRTLLIDNEPWFVALDVARLLGYSNTSDSIAKHCRCIAKCDIPHPQSLNKTIEVSIIPERDVYRLIMRSKLKAAEKFEDWVVGDVIPSIRKTGSYAAEPQLPNFNNPAESARAWADQFEQKQLAQKEVKLLTEKAAKDKPKVEFYDDVTGSDDCLDMAKVAKLLNIKGFGRNNLFQLLRDKKIIDRSNSPYQTFVDRGYFRLVESSYTKPDGTKHINIKTVVLQKGVDYIRRII